jgi:hypothetical protein
MHTRSNTTQRSAARTDTRRWRGVEQLQASRAGQTLARARRQARRTRGRAALAARVNVRGDDREGPRVPRLNR